MVFFSRLHTLFLWPFLSITVALISHSANAQQDDLRISPNELKSTLAQYTLLDARSPQEFNQLHIKNALNLPVSWTYEQKNINGQIITPARAQIVFRNLGIDKQTPIVVYDNGQLVDAARVFWMLEVYGFANVKVLDHGFDHWQDQNLATSTEIIKPEQSRYIPIINHKRIATKLTTQIATKHPNQMVIDARPMPFYLGEKSKAKRYGHIPSAINIPASHNFDNFTAFRSLQPVNELKNIYKDIPKDKKIVIYCAIGRISSSNYLALRELGYDVANYDASWKEWANDFQLPVTNKSKK